MRRSNRILALGVALVIVGTAATADPGLQTIVTPENLLTFVGSNAPDTAARNEVAWASDGSHVIFSVLSSDGTMGDDLNEAKPSLVSIDARTGRMKILGPGHKAVSASKADVVAYASSDRQVALMTTEGRLICRLLTGDIAHRSGAIRSLALSANGRQLAVAVDRARGEPPADDTQPSIAPGASLRVLSGSQVLSSDPAEQWAGTTIFVVDSHCGNAVRLADLPEHQVGSMEWVPRRKALIALAQSISPYDGFPRSSDALLIDLKSNSWQIFLENIGGQAGSKSSLYPSPDGIHFAFTYDRDGLPYNIRKQFAVASLAEKRIISVSTDPRRVDGWLDSRTLLATRLSAHPSLSQLATATIEGVEQLVPGAPGGAKLSPDGKRLAWMETDLYGESTLSVGEVSDSASGRAIHKKQALWRGASPLSNFIRAERRMVFCRSTHNVVIPAILVLPLNRQAHRRYPVVVNLHGGPAGGLGSLPYYPPPILNATSLEHDMWAAKGYAVLMPDYRASGYYGFDKIARDGTGFEQDFEDIMCHVNQLIEQGIADPARMFVIGHSYGGAEVNWIVTHSHAFAAAISKEGSSNIDARISWGISGRPSPQGTQLYGSPLDFPDRYRRMSVVEYVRGVTTPTLFVEHRAGTRVGDLYTWMYAAWRDQGIEAELRQYDEPRHVLTREADRRDVLFAAIRWIERFSVRSPSGDTLTSSAGAETKPHLRSQETHADSNF